MDSLEYQELKSNLLEIVMSYIQNERNDKNEESCGLCEGFDGRSS